MKPIFSDGYTTSLQRYIQNGRHSILKLDKELIIISGNNSRKHKQFRSMLERRKLFGDISARDENGRPDLVAHSASQGRIITSSAKYGLGTVPIKQSEKQ